MENSFFFYFGAYPDIPLRVRAVPDVAKGVFRKNERKSQYSPLALPQGKCAFSVADLFIRSQNYPTLNLGNIESRVIITVWS
jgi:hypothetical protein